MPRSHLCASTALVLLCTIGPAGAQETAERGPHGVGFRLIEARDSTRAYAAKRDVEGRLRERTARPVRLALWYPARVETDDPRMTALDFRVLRESEIDFRPPGEEVRERIRRGAMELARRLGLTEEAARSRTVEPLPVVRDAPAVPGPHPSVLYVGAAYVNDPATPVYLASHGFVVAAVPNNGRMTATSLEYSPNPLTLDTGVDDLGFAYATLRREPLADTDRLAVYAFSSPSLHALLWAMRDLQADAIVSVEGWERYRRGADLVRESPHYDALRIRVPVLLIERAADETSPSFAKVPDVVDSLAYAPRARVAFDDAEHGDFLSHLPAPRSPTRARIYPATMRLVREFLESALGDARTISGPGSVEGLYTVETYRPDLVAPSEEELFRMAEVDPAAFAATYRDLVTRGLERPPFREHVLARAARYAETAADRATLWEVVVQAYPESAVSRFRLGESLAEAGRTEATRRTLEEARRRLASDPDLDGSERAAWDERIGKALEALQW
ncbi:MAG: hypothetical protein R3326_01435 [Gemmatimonadota bacterium]|nr:hypothetical protein [Gemmatimonadota bacterium]